MKTQPHTYIIAEAGVNHNGSLDMAFQLIQAAVAAGADAIKFQTFRASSMVTQSAQKANYQLAYSGESENQLTMLQRLELTAEHHAVLHRRCQEQGIEFISTPFDPDSLALLESLGVRRLKISSGDLTDAPLLLRAGRTGLPVILSTGMATLSEIEAALTVLALAYTSAATPAEGKMEAAYMSDQGQTALKNMVTLLHCTTEYPAPYNQVHLHVLDTLKAAFGLEVGYSDHTEGISVPIAAVARGASVIEKHFTLDKTLPGPDHMASLEPDELACMIRSIRQVEAALGTHRKLPAPVEEANKQIVRKSIVVSKPVCKGELLSVDNLTCKRPGDGLSPHLYWTLLGRPATRDYQQDEQVEL